MTMTYTKNPLSGREDGHIDFAKVYAPTGALESIAIAGGDVNLSAGTTKQLTVTTTPAAAPHDGILWSSSEPAVASITENGLVKANKNGTTVITATAKNTTISASINVTVTGNDIAKYLTVVDDFGSHGGFAFEFLQSWGTDSGYPWLFYEGTNHYATGNQSGGQPTAVLTFDGVGVEVYGNLQDDQGIYNIYLDGELVEQKDAYRTPRATQQLIYARNDLADGTHVLKVATSGTKNPASRGTSISIDYAKVYHNDIGATDFDILYPAINLEVADEYALEVVTKPTYANIANITWSSSDASIVTVNENGVVCGVKPGTAVVTGKMPSGVEKKASITVMSASNKLYAMFGNTNVHYLQKDYASIVNKFRYESSLYNSDFGWKNDQINAEIVTCTKDEPVKNVSIKAQDFASEDGAVFSKDNISIQFLRETSVGSGRAGSNPSSPHTPVPDIIYSSEPKDLASQRVQSAWMSIVIPKDTKAGVYTGYVEISGDDMESILLPYTFEVMDLTQPDVQDYQGGVELWEYPYAVAKYYNIPDSELYGERHIALLRQNLKEYAAMGGNTISTAITEYPWARNNPFDYPSTIKWSRGADGKFKFDFTHFDAWVSLNLEYGISDKLKCFSMSPYYSMVYYDEVTGQTVSESVTVNSARWKTMWGQFLEAFIPHLDEKGWFDMTYTAMDEVGQNDINAIYTLLQGYPNKDGKFLKVSAAVNYGGTSQATLDRVNDISISLSHTGHKAEAQELAHDRREKGLYTSFYTCTGIYPNSFALNDPGDSAWTFWYNASTHMDGYLRWAFDNWLTTPYTSLDWLYWESGDTMLIYPDENRNAADPKIYSTPRWEKMKEGKRDVEKMYFLRDNYPELAEKVGEALDSVAIAQGATNAWGGMYAASQKDKDLINAEVIRMRAALREISSNAADYFVSVALDPGMDGGELVLTDVRNGADFTVPACEFTYAGYLFTGWSASGAATGTYQPGDVIQELSGDLTLTAIWGETVKSLKIKTPTNLAIKRATTYNFAASLEITPASAVANLVYASSNPTVASISDKGVIQALRTGTVVITVRDTISGASAAVLVTVS